MAQLLIVYHSKTGGSQQMAEAAACAAASEISTDLKRAAQAGPEDLLAADGYIFCAPENLAAIAGGDERLFRPQLLSGARKDRRQALCANGLCRVRRRKRSTSDRAYRAGMAAEGSSAAAHYLHPCSDARSNSCRQGHTGGGAVSLSRPGNRNRGRDRNGGVLDICGAWQRPTNHTRAVTSAPAERFAKIGHGTSPKRPYPRCRSFLRQTYYVSGCAIESACLV